MKSGKKAMAACVVVAAIAVIMAVVSTTLFFSERVPAGSAAKVNETYLLESDVADYVNQYRINNSLTDDGAFGQALLSQGLNVTTFRQNCINQLALNMLIGKRADDLGIQISEEDVQEQVDATKSSWAFADDAVFESTLAEHGMTLEGYEEQIRTNLAEQAIYEKEIQRRAPTDEQVLAYVQSSMAGKTLRHSCRIVFTGGDATKRAEACLKKLGGAGSAVTSAAFQAAVSEFSDEEDAAKTGGSYGWSDAENMDEDCREALNGLSQGEVSEPITMDDDNSLAIIYCDELFELPRSEDMGSFELNKLSDDLSQHMADEAADTLWESDCKAYLTSLLDSAKITYYPVPDDAAYNVNLSAVAAAADSGEAESGR